MKKQFFYAAFAITMMASCTNENEPVVDQPTPDAEEKVAIELGIASPTLSAATRATGSIGDEADSEWSGQQLYITMINKDGSVAQEDGEDILGWADYEYRAPRTADDNIRVYEKNTYTATTDKGNLQYKYYPLANTYDFIGWHVDNITLSDNNVEISTGTALIKDITITGSEDIMGARTKEFTEANYGSMITTGVAFNELTNWNFSARTARNDIKPILEFKHKLARLKFYVRAGSNSAALQEWDGTNWGTAKSLKKDASNNDIPKSTEAMYVEGIVAQNMINKIDMDLTAGGLTTASASGISYNHFSLGSKGADGTITTLDPVAPEYLWRGNTIDYSGNGTGLNTDGTSKYKGTLVGESIMFLPYATAKPEDEITDGSLATATTTSIPLEITVGQYCAIEEDERTDPAATVKYEYKTKTSKIIVNAASGTTFQPGYSYDIYITIYGFERIEVLAELSDWLDGGDIETDIENNAPQQP